MRHSTHWWEKVKIRARQLTGLWKNQEKHIDLIIHKSFIRVFYKGIQLIQSHTNLLQKYNYICFNCYERNRMVIYRNAFLLINNYFDDWTHLVSETRCYAVAWLAFIYQYSKRGLILKFWVVLMKSYQSELQYHLSLQISKVLAILIKI